MVSSGVVLGEKGERGESGDGWVLDGSEEGDPWFFAEAVDDHGFGAADVVEDGEELEGAWSRVESHVGGASGDEGHFAWAEEAFFGTDPLLGVTFDDEDDFFAAWVEVEEVGFACGEGGAAEVEFFGAGVAWGDEFFDVAPGEIDVFGIDGGEVAFEGIGVHGAGGMKGRARGMVQGRIMPGLRDGGGRL